MRKIEVLECPKDMFVVTKRKEVHIFAFPDIIDIFVLKNKLHIKLGSNINNPSSIVYIYIEAVILLITICCILIYLHTNKCVTVQNFLQVMIL